MSSTATTATSDGWWYQLATETKGPTTAEELRTLLTNGRVHLGTMVWHQAFGEAWKRLDQTDLVPRRPPPMSPPPFPAGDGPWSKIFAQFDSCGGSQIKWSFLGFFFGPLYYFYLRMWRKGWVIIGLVLWMSVLLDLFEAVPGVAQFNKVAGFAVGGVCGVLVFRDYWKLKRFGERMWPQLTIFDHAWAIVLLLIGPLVAFGAMVAYESSEPTPHAASTSSTRARPPNAPHLQRAAQSDLKESWDTADQQTLSPLDHATKNCTRWLQDTFDGAATNAYDADTTYMYEVKFVAGRLFRTPNLFGNHQALTFQATLDKTVNGQPGGFNDLPQHFCILDDSFNVMGMENDASAGLP